MQDLDKYYILDRTTQEKIWKKYTGYEISYHKWYTNPLRIDEAPDCKFYRSEKTGVIRLNDFAYAWKFDCFELVCHIYKCKYYDACLHIIKDMKLLSAEVDESSQLHFSLSEATIQKVTRNIQVATREISLKELQHWQKYINSLSPKWLKQHGCYGLDRVWVDDKVMYDYKRNDIAFVYKIDKGNKFQCAFVDTKLDIRFMLTTTDMLIGINEIDYTKSYIIITKSFKDWLLMKKFGLNVVAILSENLYVFKWVYILIKFKYKLSLFDNDRQGKRCSVVYRRDYSCIPLLFPVTDPKDFSDNLEKYGENDMLDLITEVREYYEITD